MDKIELKRRSQKFAVDIIRFIVSGPGDQAFKVLANQLLRSSTSVGANYVQPVKANRPPTLLIKSQSVKKKQMNLSIGLT